MRDRLGVWNPNEVKNTSTGKMLWTRTQQSRNFFLPIPNPEAVTEEGDERALQSHPK